MNVPKELGVHVCNCCHVKLLDEDFHRCGIDVSRHQYFFDYFCPTCSFGGSYVVAIPIGKSAGEAIRDLGIACLGAEQKGDPKGNSKDLLNRIVGVEDLLSLGGNDAPKEFTRDDDPSDLP